MEAKAATASRPRADSSILILAFPVAEAADKAGPTQDLEGSLQQQVQALLSPPVHWRFPAEHDMLRLNCISQLCNASRQYVGRQGSMPAGSLALLPASTSK